MDLLNAFAAEIEKEKHLSVYRGMLRRARPYCLDDDATEMLTELASGPTINDKLAIYRLLARLPFDTIWLEFPYAARYKARVKLGTVGPNEKFEDSPDRVGWLMQKIDETTWRAITVVQADHEGKTEIDTFPAVHVISTEGPVTFRSFVTDPVLKQAVVDMSHDPLYAGMMWGFGAHDGPSQQRVYSIPSHLQNANAVDLAPSWEYILNRHSRGDPAQKRKLFKEQMASACHELQGDLRFLMAALATINEVPITYADFKEPGSRRIGGSMREYMVNRIVTINIPKKRGRTNKVMRMLKLAEVRMRRHEVSGYWKRVHFGDGKVERRWINSYMRGDAELGYVRQERHVEAS